jgi:hypothetical protein
VLLLLVVGVEYISLLIKIGPRAEMKIISWNYRGLGNASAVRGLLDLQKRESQIFSSCLELRWTGGG